MAGPVQTIIRGAPFRTAVLIGAGNMGWHLGQMLNRAGVRVLQVYSRNRINARMLAGEFQALDTNRLEEIHPDADLYAVCVADSAIAEVVSKIPSNGGFWIHLAGTVETDVFRGKANHFGVLYPVQTFTKGTQVAYSKIPLLVEAEPEADLQPLIQLARRISEYVVPTGFQTRARVHLAAVFAANFTNHFFSIAENILAEQGMEFELLRPLIKETFAKVLAIPPIAAQTGPAIRNDRDTMVKHNQLLSEHPRWQELYRMISESILSIKQGEP